MRKEFKKDMISYLGMTKRNIKVYLKDSVAVFFSMLGPIIVLGLYLLFLKQNYVNVITNNMKGLEELISKNNIDAFINSWLLAGILGTSCITVSINSLSIMVYDKQKKIDFDYSATPIKNHIVVLSYFTGAFICTLLITSGVLLFGLGYLAITGTYYITFIGLLRIILALLLGCISATIIMMLIVSFFKSTSAMGAFSGIITAMVGFVIGAYIPISEFPNSVQTFANFIPGSHIAALFRNELMLPILNKMNDGINNLDGGLFMKSMSEVFSFKLNIFGYEIDKIFMYSYVSIITIIVLLVNVVLYRYSSKRK